MDLGAAYHHYLQLAGDHGAAMHALLLAILLLLVIRLAPSTKRTGTSSANKRKQQQPLPPSPPGKLPVIGHLHLIGAEAHVSIRDLDAKHGRNGLLLLRVGAVPTLFVSSPSAADAVLRAQDHIFASRPPSMAAEIIRYGPSDVAFVPYGEYWRQARKLLTTHMLSTKKVQSFRHGRQQEVRLVMERIRAAATAVPAPAAVDLSDLLSGYTNDVVCRAVLGASHRNQGRNRLFRELTEINVSLLGGFNLEDYFPPKMAMADVLLRLVSVKAKRVTQRWNDVFDELIQEHVQSKPSGESEESETDFIHVLLSIQEEYGLTTDNLKAILVDMFEAGIETSYATLEYCMAELINNRHIMKKLQTEVRTTCSPCGKKLDMFTEEDLGSMPYLKATIKETLRLHPPAPFLLPHYSMDDSEIDGYFIPGGTRVLVNAWALGRDPTTWEKPDEFMPERFVQEPGAVDVHMKGKDLRFIPFGSGRRICPGMNFAFATMEIMLANLMYHFDWEVPHAKEGASAGVSMEESFALTIRRKEKLLLVPRIVS